MRRSVLFLAAACVLAAAPALAQQSQGRQSQGRPGLTQGQLAQERNVLTAAQRRLQQLGYHTAPSGKWNADTSNAVELFQSDHGLRPTGEVDLQTLAALGVDVSAPGATAMLAPEPGQQSAMLPPESNEQTAAAEFQSAPAYNLPIFTTYGGHSSPPQTRSQAAPFATLGSPQPLVVQRTGRIPGVDPSAPTEDIVR